MGPQGIKMTFYLMQNNIPTKILNCFDKKMKSIRGVKKETNRIITDDPNYLYTFYLFSSFDSLINAFSLMLDKINSNHIEKYFPFQSYGLLLSNYKEIIIESKKQHLDTFTTQILR